MSILAGDARHQRRSATGFRREVVDDESVRHDNLQRAAACDARAASSDALIRIAKSLAGDE